MSLTTPRPSPIASVILPAYNASDTISDTIESVLTQTFEDYELIIIDDGSTDKTKHVIESFEDERIVFISRANKGLVETLNEAIAMSKGSLIFRIDADDIAHTERFEKQVSFMSQNPSIGILGTQATIIDDYGQKIGSLQSPLFPEATYVFSKYACPVLHPTYCVRKEVYEQLNGYRSVPCEDYDFILRGVEAGIQLQNLPEQLLEYRISKRGITRSNPRRIVEATHIHQKLHAIRILGDDEGPLLNKLKGAGTTNVIYFRWLHSRRAKFIQKRSTHPGLSRLFAIAAIALFSLGHLSLLRDSFKKYRSKRVLNKELRELGRAS